MTTQRPSIGMVPDQTALAAWRKQLAYTAPVLSATLMQRQPELLPHFAAFYCRLACLPRQVRRRLQRQCRRMRCAHRLSVQGTHPPSLPHRARRQSVQSLASVALLLALGQAPALAATINVGGGCKLVDAITAANTNNAIGLCKAGRGADTIVLSANSTHTLTGINNNYIGPSGLPLVTSQITIAGNGSIIARSQAVGTPDFRILAVGAGGNLTLRQTVISGGRLPAASSNYRGGGVYRRSGRLTVDRCTISGNQASLGGGMANSSVVGTLTVTNSTIAGNTATGDQGGGGIYNRGALIVTNSTIFGNRTISDNSGAVGGGVRNIGIATITNSSITGNRATYTRGGGVANLFLGSLTVTNSTISGNTARDGGGVWNKYQGTVTVTNSTISRNTAGFAGAGLYNGSGLMSLTNSTVVGNVLTGAQSAGGGVYSGGRVGNLRSDVVLRGTLISGNDAVVGDEIFQRDGGVISANSFNLFGHIGVTTAQALSGFIPSVASDITATSNGNRPTAIGSILDLGLANNGGPTQTHALIPGSPAIEGAGSCPTKDQRGVARPQDGDNDGFPICDIGAFERAP